MKRVSKKIFLFINIFLFIFTLFFAYNKNIVNAENKKVETEYAIYEEDEIKVNQMLGYGINHINTTAITTAKRYNYITEETATNSPQNVNILSVPSAKNVRVVNYTYPNDEGWTRQTLTKMVESFESNNPGWTVIAGVNGDFYDWHSLDKALPLHTTGSTVSNGDVLRACETKSIGYTNNGTTNTFKLVNNATFTDYHTLTIYDENENIVATYDIDKINEAPSKNEVAVYYTYRENVDEDGDGEYERYDEIKITVPATNSFISTKPIRCLPTAEPELFAKGAISNVNEEITLKFGEFAIVTGNEEIKNKLEIGTTIRVQKNLTGELADCDQVMGVGSTLIEDGVISTDNSDGMRLDRHPRTCVGVKEDGTMMFFVIDGRQLDKNMYGMTQDEMGAMMSYYGCVDGVNVDGGGSSTFGIRDENGNFVVVNSPSDGDQRPNANYLLVAVPELNIEMSDYTHNSVKLSYGKLSKGIEISNLKVTINGIEKEMSTNELIFDGLNPQTLCEFTYNYDIKYGGITNNVTSIKQTFTTGKVPPTLDKFTFDIVGDNTIIEYKITDINSLITMSTLKYGGGIKFIENAIGTFQIPQNSINDYNITVDISYRVASVPETKGRIEETAKWYPRDLNLYEYGEEEIKQIDSIIDRVNEEIRELSKEAAIDVIKASKTELLHVITKAEKEELQIFEDMVNSLPSADLILSDNQSEIDSIKDYYETLSDRVKFFGTMAYDKLLSLEEKIDENEISKAKTDAINKLNQLVDSKTYSSKNKEKVTIVLEAGIKAINNAKDVGYINQIYSDTVRDINEVKEKGCKSSSMIILVYTISLMSIGLYFIKKKH